MMINTDNIPNVILYITEEKREIVVDTANVLPVSVSTTYCSLSCSGGHCGGQSSSGWCCSCVLSTLVAFWQ